MSNIEIYLIIITVCSIVTIGINLKFILDNYNIFTKEKVKSKKGICILQANGEKVNKVIENETITIFENENKTIFYIFDTNTTDIIAKVAADFSDGKKNIRVVDYLN